MALHTLPAEEGAQSQSRATSGILRHGDGRPVPPTLATLPAAGRDGGGGTSLTGGAVSFRFPRAPWICFDSPTATPTVARAVGAERGAESLRATSGAGLGGGEWVVW